MKMIDDENKVKKLVVMIPAYNEEETIGNVIKSIPRDCARKVEVLVMDDGSKDSTREISLNAGADKVVTSNKNSGLGTNFKNGINQALKMGADIIVNVDADGQFNSNDIPKLIKPIIEGKADMVTCSRFKDKKLIPKMPKIKIFGNRFFARMLNFFLGTNYYDTQCGFRAYSREAALRLILFGKFTYTQEVFIDLVKKGFRIIEIPCEVIGERKGKSRVVNNVLSYGLKVLLIIVRTTRDYEPFKFFGFPGFMMVSLGVVSSLILFVRWIFLSMVDPFLIVVYANVFLIIVGVLLIMLGLLADMLDRNRQLQEEVLYKLKRNEISELQNKS